MPDQAKENRNKLIFLLSFSCLFYIINAYLIQRTYHFALFSSFSALFILYLFTIKIVNSDKLIRFAIIGSIVIRLCLIFSIPNLSDDFYRFIWDGRLINSGENPFSHTPSYYIGNPEENPIGYDLELYKAVNSQNYFTIYPPCVTIYFLDLDLFFSLNIHKCSNNALVYYRVRSWHFTNDAIYLEEKSIAFKKHSLLCIKSTGYP